MKRNSGALLAGIFVLALASQSFAAVSSFHFFDPKLLAHSDVQGQTFAPESGSPIYQATLYGGKLGLPPGSNARAYLVDYGLGVMDTGAPYGDRIAYLKRVLVDGTYGAEYIRLVFNDPVQVTQVKFAMAGPFERFDLAVDGVNLDVPGDLRQ